MAWAYSNPKALGQGGVRAAYGPLIGRWPASQVISGSWSVSWTTGHPWSGPQLALARDGAVLLAWNGCKSESACMGYVDVRGSKQPAVVVSWRSPGHPFGSPRTVSAAPFASVPQFDAAGNAYLSSSCSGTVAIAAAHSQHFSRRVVTAGAAQSFTLALSGAGQGLAAWVAGACSYSDAAGPGSGPVLASVLHSGTFATPITLTPATTQSAWAGAVPTPGGAVVTWLSYERGNVVSFSVPVAANGVIGAPSEGETVTVPLAADGGGDLLLEPETAVAGPASAIVVRPAGGGTDQPAPVSAGRAAAARDGRVIAIVWIADSTKLELSIWRP